MLGPPWAKKFWSRANQLLRGAPIRCQNRPKQAKRGSKKSPQTLPFSHFQVMVGHLGPKYLGNTPNVKVTSTQSKKSARAYPWYPVELTFLLVVQFEKFQVLFVYIIHMLVFSDHFDLLDIPGYARAYPPPNGWGVPIGANFLVSSPIWEISSSICISHTYFSVFWPFWPTGHPRVCPGIPTTQWGCPLGLTFLLVAQFEKFQVLFVYRIHILVFSDLLTILTYWAYPLPNGWGMPIALWTFMVPKAAI